MAASPTTSGRVAAEFGDAVAIFEMFLHHRAVPAEQRNPVRAQLDKLAAESGVRTGYEILAVDTRKKIKRLGKS